MSTVNSVSTNFYNRSHSNLNWVLASKKEGALKSITSKISGLDASSFPFKTQTSNLTIIQNSTDYTVDLIPFIESKIDITSLIFKCTQANILLAKIPPKQLNLSFKIEDPKILELMPEDYTFSLLDNESRVEYQCSMLKIVDKMFFSKSNPTPSHIGHLSFDNYLEELYQEIGAFKKQDSLDGMSMALKGKRKDLCSATYPAGTVLKSNAQYFLRIYSITEFPTSISFSIQDNLETISKVTFAPSEFSNPNGITFQIKVPEVLAGNSTLILNLGPQKYTFPTRICTQSDIEAHWLQTFNEKYRDISAPTQQTLSKKFDTPVSQSLLEESFKRKTEEEIPQAIVDETNCEETELHAKKSRKKQNNTQTHPLFGTPQLAKNSKEVIGLTNNEENYAATTTHTCTSESTFKEDAFTTTPSNTSQENGLNITAISSSIVEDLEQLFPEISTYIYTDTK